MIADPKPRKRTKKLPPWKRKPDAYCTAPRCHRPRRAIMRCATHAVRELDTLWARLVKAKGYCEICRSVLGLQAAHGFSRRYGGTRWVLLNGFCLCNGCHIRYTHDSLGWTEILRKAWGDLVYEELREIAQHGGRPDFELTYAALVEAA